MKKIINKIRKIFTMVGGFLALGVSRSLAAPAPLYGVEKPDTKEIDTIGGNIVNIIKNKILPTFIAIFILGAVIYFKKSKSTTKKKIFIIFTIAIIFIIFFALLLGEPGTVHIKE